MKWRLATQTRVLFCVIAAPTSNIQAADPWPALQFSDQPPPGFESLAEPQTVLVDLYYGGRLLLSTMATTTPETVQFEDPAAIAASIPDLSATDPVIARLSQPLPHHAERLCPPLPRPGCGRLEPEVAAVIFDYNRFRADLFIAPQFLLSGSTDQPRFLPPGDSAPSYLQLLNLTASAGTGRSNDYNLSGDTLLSFGSQRLESLWSYSDRDRWVLETLQGVREAEGFRFEAGTFRTAGMRLAAEQDVLGIGMVSTLVTRVDLDQAFGSQLQLFLPLRSQVDIFKDGRLLASAFYEAGNRTLDTSRLPDGAYQVTLRIRDSSGAQREQTRLFTKTVDIPPADQPFYTLQAGFLRKTGEVSGLPRYTNTLIGRFGTSRRLTDTLGIDAGLLAGGGQAVGELGMTWLTPGLRLDAGLMGSLDQDFGVAATGRFYFGQWTGFGNLQRVWADGNQPASGFDPIPESFLQASGALTWHLPRVDLRLAANRQQREHQTSWSISPEITTRLLRSSGMQLDFVLGHNYTNRGWDLQGQLRLFHWHGRSSANAMLGYRHIEPDRDARPSGRRGHAVGSLNLGWNDGDLFSDQLQLNAGVGVDVGGRRANGHLDYRTTLGRLQLAAERSEPDNAPAINLFSGNLSTALASDFAGVTLGGQELRQSSLIIELNGDPDDGQFDVLVDDQPRTVARAGHHTVLQLPPYQSYDVRLRPRRTGFVAFDAGTRSVTLYPGNVIRLRWDIRGLLVALAKVVDLNGAAIGNARVSGGNDTTYTEPDGSLQVEITDQTRTLTLQAHRHAPCEVAIPAITNEQMGVVFLGTLKCR